MPSANTFYDGPSVTLAAGTWIVGGQVNILTGGTAVVSHGTAVLWDGTTVYASGADGGPPYNGYWTWTIPIAPVPIILAVQTTLKLSVAVDANSNTMKAAPQYNSKGATLSYITALKIA
jgi:hypothetical protein